VISSSTTTIIFTLNVSIAKKWNALRSTLR
jgi:hypothetical protein